MTSEGSRLEHSNPLTCTLVLPFEDQMGAGGLFLNPASPLSNL